MDRTILNLASLLLGGTGLFLVLTKFNVRELNQTFVGENPFAVKRDVINAKMTWIFTTMALFGLLLQVLAEVLSDRLPTRLHDVRFYIVFFLVGLVATVLLVVALTALGKTIARRIWLPKVVAKQSAIYKRTRFVIEHNGWREGQLSSKEDSLPDADRRREANIQNAEQDIQQIEKLLELPHQTGSLPERIERLRPYFDVGGAK